MIDLRRLQARHPGDFSMNARQTFRSLLTTTSMAALFVASNGAGAATPLYDNPYGDTIGQIYVSSIAPYVSNAGSIANFYGEDGIEIVGTTVEGSISNSGSISISDVEDGDDVVRGISVSGATIWGDIGNSGSIAVMAEGMGYGASRRYAAGIELGEESLFSGSVGNSGLIDVSALVANVDEYGGEDGTTALEAMADAYGIRLDNTGSSSSGEIFNSGSIRVEAKATVNQTALHEDNGASARGDGYASAYAAGIDARNGGNVDEDHRGPGVAGDVYLYSYDEGIEVAATAQSFSDVQAAANCEGSDESCFGPHYAEADVIDDASAQAYGVTLSGNAAVVGGIYNDAVIDVSALAETHSLAEAGSFTGSARAFAGYREDEGYEYYETGTAEAAATGLNLDLLQVNGDIESSEDIYAHATANGQSTASADSSSYAEAMASNNVYAIARGIAVDTLVVSGDFSNSAAANGLAEANSNNSSTAVSGEAESGAASGTRATAAGIDFEADALGGTFTNENNGYWEDSDFYGEAVKGEAVARSVADALATGGEHSRSEAFSRAQAEAHGINAEVRSIAGNFINDGSVQAKAVASGEQTATISGGESLDALAYGMDLEADATGLRLSGDILAGSFYNDGKVVVEASVTGVSTALATGLDDVLAAAGNSASAYARGIVIEEGKIQDHILNDGKIRVSAKADVTQTATASASEDGEGDAAALAMPFYDDGLPTNASAQAIGLNIESEEIGGSIVNSERIVVDATANVASVVSAAAINDGEAWSGAASQAYAEAYGIRAEIGEVGFGSRVVESEYGVGYFVNSGSITVHAGVDIVETATATSDDGEAGAAALLAADYGIYSCYDDCGPDANAVAYGIALDSSEEGGYLAGSFLNLHSVVAEATAVASLNASALVDDGEDTPALAVAGGELASRAVGIALDDLDADGGFYNESDITVTARTEISADAFADSDDGPAFAAIGSSLPYDFEPGYVGANYAAAGAVGVDINDSAFEDGFWNDGDIAASAFAEARAAAEVIGDEEALAVAGNYAGAQAVGVSLADSWFGDDIVNTGMISGMAAASTETDASAHGDVAQAYIGDSEDGAAWTTAMAIGLWIDESEGVDVRNGNDVEDDESDEAAQIWALAGAFGNNRAVASGETLAAASARNVEQASATGYDDDDVYGGSFINNGLVVAGALAYGQESARATAYTTHSIAAAIAFDATDADAVGVDTAAFEVSNYGAIFAGAGAIANADAKAEGAAARAEAIATADASATGIVMRAASEDGSDFYNAGDIEAYALAQAHASAESLFSKTYDESWSVAEAFANAEAVGVNIASGSHLQAFHNDKGGAIRASAQAEAMQDGEPYWQSDAKATGLYVSRAAIGNIQNDGEIHAEANALGSAYARGIHIDGGDENYRGILTNTGVVAAKATSESPNATAVLITGGGMVSAISNSGEIRAEIEDTSAFELFEVSVPKAVAIDIRGAGVSVNISQLQGSIVGDILTANGRADTTDWSGGTIDGDIIGNESEDGDVLNIFAGEDSEFNYGGTIDGLAAFNINGGAHADKVALRLSNLVQNVQALNVGPNATMTLGTAADISTGALNLDASATLAFELTSEGANAVINTSSADLGGATVKAVFLDAGQPVSQSYRIINWDGSDTRFGSVVSNSLIEKIVAQYGEDGVDLLASRLSFADINGLQDSSTSFGKALDRIFDDIDPDSELGQAIYQLITLTPEEYAEAMNGISGQQTADMQSITFSQAGSLIHVIQTQLSELRGGTITSADARSLGIRVASNQLVASMSDAPQPGFGQAAGSKVSGDWSAWARVFGDWAELDRSSVSAGFTSTSGGVIVGGDFSFSPNFIAGLAAGYQSSDIKFRGTGAGDISSYSLTAYGDYRIGAVYVDALAGYAVQSYDMDRYLAVLGTSYIANGDYDGASIIGSVETGYEVALGGNTKLTPFAGINITHTTTDAVTETGAGVWNLAYEDRSETGIDSVLGVRLSKSFTTEGGTKFTPMVELGWKHAFGDQSPVANAALAGTPGSNFQIFGSTAKRDTAIAGAALNVQMTDTLDAYVQYNGQYSSNYMDNTASLRLRLKF